MRKEYQVELELYIETLNENVSDIEDKRFRIFIEEIEKHGDGFYYTMRDRKTGEEISIYSRYKHYPFGNDSIIRNFNDFIIARRD